MPLSKEEEIMLETNIANEAGLETDAVGYISMTNKEGITVEYFVQRNGVILPK